jgi:hypothetical protein
MPFAVLGVSLALLTGCGPKKPVAMVSPAVEAPELPPSRMAQALPLVPPPFPPVNQTTVKLDTTTPPEVKPEVATERPQKPPKHHVKPASDETKASSTPPPTPTAQVATVQPPEQSPIGQLSESAVGPVNRSAISTRIDSTENGLNSIKRTLNSDEQKTVTLIRQYITRARDALKVDDLDGADKMSSKAQQMLQELTKP